MPRADVRGHDDDRVLEIDGIAETVSELTIFKYLQQDVEDIRVRFLDFIEQYDGVRRALHTFGELSTLFIANVSGRRADQLRHRVLLHELGHVEADQSLLGAEHELRERARYFGFADAGRTEKQEGTDGPVRAFQAGTAASDGAGKRGDGFRSEERRVGTARRMERTG